MLNDREIANVGSNFSRSLRQSIKAHYGRMPSAAFLSREFNLRQRGLKAISSETFRRWVHGLSIPRPDHLRTLVAWLNLDLNRLYGSGGKLAHEPSGYGPAKDPRSSIEMSELMYRLLGKLSDAQRQEISAIVSLMSSRNVAI